MFFQTRKKQLGLQNFILKIINNNNPDLKALIDGPRSEKRTNLAFIVLVVPLVDGKLQTDNAFHVVTKELSTNGIGVVIDQQVGLDEAILGFTIEGDMTLVHAKAKHLTPMGGGLFHLGLMMDELIPLSRYPELEAFKF